LTKLPQKVHISRTIITNAAVSDDIIHGTASEHNTKARSYNLHR